MITMSRNTYAKPTTTNASFLKVPVNLKSDMVASLTWKNIVDAMPLLKVGGDLPIKAIKLGAITVGGSPDAPAHLEFKGGQTFDLPALATKPMRVKASEKNLYVTGWRRIVKQSDGLHVLSNTDDDDLTESVVIRYQGSIAYIEVALRFNDDAGYRPWYIGGDLPEGPYHTYQMVAGFTFVNGKYYVGGTRTTLVYDDINLIVVGEETSHTAAEMQQYLADGVLLRNTEFYGSSFPSYGGELSANKLGNVTFAEDATGVYFTSSSVPMGARLVLKTL